MRGEAPKLREEAPKFREPHPKLRIWLIKTGVNLLQKQMLPHYPLPVRNAKFFDFQ